MTRNNQTMRPHLLRMTLTATLLLNHACGGSAPAPKAAEPPLSGTLATKNSSDDDNAFAGPDCSDGTCFKCGEALCLSGFYCDESAAVANCQWLSKCDKAAGCSCIQQTLGAGCTCSQRSGGMFVKCSS